jgi:undecaprenyl-diphosphatase
MNPALLVSAHDLFVAAALGLVEGVTEFLPISSTGHLIVAGEWLGWTGPRAATFEIFIQLGAILAIVWLYRDRLAATARHPFRPEGRAFWLPLLVAFLPAAVVGLLLHHWIKAVLFRPAVVAGALVVGGLVILVIERARPAERVTDATRMPLGTAFGIGLAQVLSLIPGTSRSGATILGAYALGCTRPAATLFSFFLAIPVMVAATLFDLASAWHTLGPADILPFAVGFVTAFVSAVVVVRAFLRYVASNTFTAFAWYRIAFGLLLGAWYWTR